MGPAPASSATRNDARQAGYGDRVQRERRFAGRGRATAGPCSPAAMPGGSIARKATAVIVDGYDYFRHLDHALRQARRSILIIGWDFDGTIRLTDAPDAPALGPLLHSLVEAGAQLSNT